MDDGYYDSFESSGESGQEENEFEMKETAPAISLPPSYTGGKEDDLIRNANFFVDVHNVVWSSDLKGTM